MTLALGKSGYTGKTQVLKLLQMETSPNNTLNLLESRRDKKTGNKDVERKNLKTPIRDC